MPITAAEREARRVERQARLRADREARYESDRQRRALKDAQAPSRAEYEAERAGVEAQYNPMIQEQRQYNIQREAGTSAEGLVSGRTRYASNIQSGILADVVDQGLNSVNKIILSKNAAIAAAAAARDRRDYETMQAQLKAAEDAKKAAADEARKIKEDAIKAAEEERASKKFTREESEAEAENLAPSISSVLTGDPEKDMETIKGIADTRKIDANILMRYVDKYKADVQDRLTKNMPTLVKEYQYATSNGFFDGTFMEYQKVRSGINKGAPKSKVLSLKEGVKIGLPELAGVSEDELAYDLIDPTPPNWFLDKYYSMNPSDIYSNPDKIYKAWKSFRTDPTISNYTKGINKDTNVLDFLNSLPNLSDYNPDTEQ